MERQDMTTGTETCRIAVIGAGPRALGALEALIRHDRDAAFRIEIFDPRPWPGAGPNFSPDQSGLCKLNLPLRSIDLGRAPWDGADFAEGTGGPAAAERFPARAELGGYLAARLARLMARTGIAVTPRRITGIRRRDEAWFLEDGASRHGPYDEVLLAQGQPATMPDKQLETWRDHAERHGLDLVAAYPDHRLLRQAQNWAGKPVGVRGLGLSTLDVVRLLTLGLGGRFADGRYHRSGREPARILPFSLDGHAPAPKPADATQDARFEPTETETRAFRAAVAQAMAEGPDQALAIICDAIHGPVLRILSDTGGAADAGALNAWLSAEREKPGSQEDRPAATALRAAIDEAHGRAPPSAGYVTGQLMRKWQNALRQGFNPNPAAPATAAAIVGFDDGLKRFSYGPPVASAQELLILIQDGLVDPRAAHDPDIVMTGTGWRLVEHDTTAEVAAMVDAVLPPPDLGRLDDPLMRGLIDSGRVTAIEKGLGARIRPDGRLIGRDGSVQPGLCLLGRLAMGSVIAADSIHDCFGAAADRWAQGVAARVRDHTG